MFISDLDETMEYTQIASDTLLSNSQYAGGGLFRGTSVGWRTTGTSQN